MKKFYVLLAGLLVSVGLNSQCMVQVLCNPVTCPGNCDGSATAYANGVPPFTYLWMPGGQTTQSIYGLCAGTYTVAVTDSTGCTSTAQCTVQSPPPLQAMFTNVVNPTCPTCCDGSFTGTSTGGTSPYSYTLWPPSGPPYPFPSMNNACNGTYVLCVTDANGCYSCDTIALSAPLSIGGNSSSENLSVTNSGNGIFQLNASFQTAQSGDIVVTNVMGQDVLAQHFSSGASLSNSIDLSDQPAGMYFVSVITASGVRSVRIVK